MPSMETIEDIRRIVKEPTIAIMSLLAMEEAGFPFSPLFFFFSPFAFFISRRERIIFPFQEAMMSLILLLREQ